MAASTSVFYAPSYPLLLSPIRNRTCLNHCHVSSSSFAVHSTRSHHYGRRRTCLAILASGLADNKPEMKVEREPMVPPYNVLITGSTKGIGYALAREFMKAGDNVIICSRSAERVEETVSSLRSEFGEQHVELSVMLGMGRMLKT